MLARGQPAPPEPPEPASPPVDAVEPPLPDATVLDVAPPLPPCPDTTDEAVEPPSPCEPPALADDATVEVGSGELSLLSHATKTVASVPITNRFFTFIILLPFKHVT